MLCGEGEYFGPKLKTQQRGPNTQYWRKRPGEDRRKRPEHREKLLEFFAENASPSVIEMEDIAGEIGLDASVVKNWFMNQRAKGWQFHFLHSPRR